MLHAAGPGHGKAVLAAYMVANGRALRRGIVLSFLAALLQALVAIGLVVVLAFVLHATASRMRDAATLIERLSYAGIALFGAWLVWGKSRAVLAAWSHRRVEAGFGFRAPAVGADLAFAGRAGRAGASRSAFGADCVDPACLPRRGAAAFSCDAAHEHGPGCGHVHAPDPASLGDDFTWRGAASTVIAAGARPCSGAILVMVFALAQGALLAGVALDPGDGARHGDHHRGAGLARRRREGSRPALERLGSTGEACWWPAGSNSLAAALVLAVGLSLLFGMGPLQALA